MATWNSGGSNLWSTGKLWAPLTPAGSTTQNTKLRRNTVKRKYYYPGDFALRPEWHTNLAAKLLQYGAAPLALQTADINNGVADNLYMAYGLGDWITNVREYAPACTSALKVLASGTGGGPFVFPPCLAPALPTLPVGADPVLAGALDRIFKLIKVIKSRPGYTEAIGIDMGIVGSEEPPPPPAGDVPPPRITVTAISGDTFQYARCKFIKDGHQNVEFQGRRGNGDWEELGLSNKSPFIDDRPLLVANQAEVREIRARFVDDNLPTSPWCGVEKVTISP